MGYFVFKKTNTGVKFDLVAGNHEIIATSEVYKTDSSCKKGIASVRRNAPIANLEDKTVEPVVTARCP
ncbi:MAG: YegP family protein, partial [Clostridia bacterium]|nr:YegP family protein [Clostridia bacterium]